jgi:hypothetical protein
MAQWNQATGTGGNLQLQITEVGTNAGANTSDVHVNAQIYTPPGSYHLNADLSVSLSGSISWSTGTWSFTSAGGWHTLYDGTVTVGHNSDGTGSFSATFALNDSTGTSGVAGPASVGGSIGLTTLTVAPGTPTGVSAAYVSDSQLNVSWTNHYASNGTPTQTNVAQSVNGAAYATVLTTGNVASAVLSTAPNRKTTFIVGQGNGAGFSANSAASAAVWTTPAAPTAATATKQPDGSIVVAWTNNVAYTEYATEVWHGTVAAGVTTWGSSPAFTAAAGATAYADPAPDVTKVHVYEVRAKTTSGTTRYSGYAVTNTVQLLAPPNAPSVAGLAQYADKAQPLVINWTHNPVDSTAETAYEVARSTDGGTTWTTTGKTAGTLANFTIAASTYAANVALTVRVRTWGQASTGGSDGAGGSPWSTLQTVTFKTAPTASITAPTSAGIGTADLYVTLAYAQAEGAAFVSAAVTLLHGGSAVETVTTTASAGILFNTKMANGATYTVQAVVTSSIGLTATAAPVTFLVTFAPAAPGTITATYVPEAGMTQLALTFPAPTGPQVPAVTYTLTRAINGGAAELLALNQPISAATLIDTIPTINGTNTYTLTTYSTLGAASSSVSVDLATSETQWAFLSTGAGFATYLAFYGNLAIGSTPTRDSALILAAGRARPIALFGQSATLDVDVAATFFTDEGSTPDQAEAFMLTATRSCYRDPTGRRIFGLVKGARITNRTPLGADVSFTVSEAS